MSSRTTLARPYAKAAFGLAQDDSHNADALGSWLGMLSFASDIAVDELVTGVLTNPLVSPAQAIDLLAAAGADRFDQRFCAFLFVLGESRRLALLPEITALFRKLKLTAEQRLQVRVVVAKPMNEDQTGRMSKALALRFKCAIDIASEVDPNMLGGAVIYAGDQVIDGSLLGRLHKLSNALLR